MIETFKAVLSNKQEEGEEKQTDRKTQKRTVGMREGQRESFKLLPNLVMLLMII